MINTVLTLAIICGSMLITIQAVDIVLRWLNIMKRGGTPPSKSAQITEGVIDSLQLYEYSPHHVSTISACDIETGICSETITSVEGLAEGIEALSESVGESISAIIEALSNR